MSLADQIIEHGPYAWDEHQQEPRPDITGQLCDAAGLNELRDELIAARALKALLADGRFNVAAYPDGDATYAAYVGLGHDGCPSAWHAEIDHFSTLGELVQRAGEHTEVCG